MFDPLVRRAADGSLQPALAASWEYLDEKTLKVCLQEGVRFHNGEEFTSESVKFTFSRVVDPDTGSPQKAQWEAIESVETPSKYVAIIKTKEPFGPLLINMNILDMLPPSAASEPDFATHPVGTGPFSFAEWVRGSHVVMDRFEDCWAGAPKLDRVIYRVFKESSTMVAALETGEIHIAAGIPAEEIDALEQTGIDIAIEPKYRHRNLWINSTRKPLDILQVRKALAYAIDPRPLVEYIMGGVGTVADAPLAPGVFGRSEGLFPYPYDPAIAKLLLADAGYPNGFETSILIAEIEPRQKELAESIAAQLADVGITAEVVVQDRAVWVENFVNERYDMVLTGTTALTGDADFTIGRLYMSETSFVGYHNKELDEYLLAAKYTNDLAARQEAYNKAQKLLWEDVATVYLFYDAEVYGIRPEVINFSPRNDGWILVMDSDLEE